MDSLTHIVLGGAIGQALFQRRLGRAAWIVGAIAATLPDADVLIRTGDSLLDHVLHRYFTHALVLVPVLGFLAALPFAATRRLNRYWRELMLAGMLAALSHVLLDACTSYGTCLLWPVSDRRISWDIIAVIDPAFTLPLVLGLYLSTRRKSPRPAAVALAIAAAYLGLATIQHVRAAALQRTIIAERGQVATRARVTPLLGTINGYRSLYEADGKLYADAIRVPFWRGGMMRRGATVAAAPIRTMTRDEQRFIHFADGYVARVPHRPEVLGDMRYSIRSDGFEPLWGATFEPPRWVNLQADYQPRGWRTLWRETIGRGEWRGVRNGE